MSLLSECPFLPKPAIFNLIIECAFGFGIGIWNIALNFHLKFLGFSTAEIGLLISIGFFSTAISSFFCGRLSDKVGFSRVSALGGFMVGISLLTIACTTLHTVFYVAQLIYGFGLACIVSTDFPLITSYVLPSQKQVGYNLTIFIYFVSSVIGNFFAGFFPKLFPSFENPYQVLLIISALSYFTLGCTRIWLPKQPLANSVNIHLLDILRNRSILSFLLFGFVTMTIFNCIMSMLNLILRQRYGLSDDIIGSMFSLISIIGSMAVPVVSFLCQRYSNRSIASATLIVQMLAILAMTFAPIWLFVLLVCTRTMTTNFVYSVVDSPMLQSVNTDRRGTYSGLRVFANYIGMGLGSAISGCFVSKEQYALLFLVAGILCLAQNLIFHYICVPHIRDYE